MDQRSQEQAEVRDDDVHRSNALIALRRSISSERVDVELISRRLGQRSFGVLLLIWRCLWRFPLRRWGSPSCWVYPSAGGRLDAMGAMIG